MTNPLLKRLQILENQQSALVTQHVKIEGSKLTVLTANPRIFYEPSKTGEDVHACDDFVRMMMGPFGSGKSSTCCAEIVMRACKIPPWYHGMRKSKWALIRNTAGELKATTLQTWLRWFECLGDYRKNEKPYLTYEYTFNDGNGVVILELIFLAIDDPRDFRKLKSMEVTGVYVNEACEVPNGIMGFLKGRVNHRYPPLSLCPEYWCGILCDTNPPDTDDPIYKTYEVDKPPGHRMFKQPPGLLVETHGDTKIYKPNPNCDNFKHLSLDYYIKMTEGQSEEFIKVYCLGDYGAVIMGKRVYPEYNDDLHSTEIIDYLPGLPLYLGWDFGLTPACIVCQFTERGQLRFIKEFIAEDMGIEQFASVIVIPGLALEFPGYVLGGSWGDPAGNARADTDESTCIDSLNILGIKTEGASTNAIVKRVESVKYFANRIIDGRAALLVSRSGCPVLRKGFLGGYHFKRIAVSGDERYQDMPNKNKYSHPHDGAQYVAMGVLGDDLVNARVEKIKKINQSITNQTFTL